MHITTPRLTLREFVFDDWHAVYEYQRDPRYLRFYRWENRSEHDARWFVEMFLHWQRARPRHNYQVAIILSESNTLIGNCGVRIKDAMRGIADLGYEINPLYWSHGYATEAAHAMLDYGFAELKLKRIWAQCIAENSASARVLTKIGLRFERREHQKEYVKGHWYDLLTYALHDHEWRALRPTPPA